MDIDAVTIVAMAATFVVVFAVSFIGLHYLLADWLAE